VLNTLTDTTSRMHLQNGRSTGSGAYTWKGTTSRVMVASRPKIGSDQIAASVPEIMDTLRMSKCLTLYSTMVTERITF
jgi:hypothetical protein